MVFGQLTSYFLLLSKSFIFATLGFASVKLRFAEHGHCSREPQESYKRAVSELEESPWEPLGLSWGLPGGSWGAPGSRLGSLRPFLGSKSAQHSITRTQDHPRHCMSQTLEKSNIFRVFSNLRQPQDSTGKPPETSRELLGDTRKSQKDGQEDQGKVKELKRTLPFDSSVTILVPAIALSVSF